MQKSVDIFLGYATEDKELCLEVKKRLRWLEREGLIRTWHEYSIGAGMEREREILRYLEMAQIILLFVSADFIASDFCYGVELKRAMERHRQGTARVIPIILRSVYWQETPLGGLRELPRENKPVANWPDRDEILAEIEKDIRILVKELVAERYIEEGRDFFEHGQYEKVIDCCEYALRWVPDSIAAYHLRSFALLALKRYDEALTAYDRLLRLEPGSATIYQGRGDALYYLKRYADALASYREAIVLQPDFVLAYTSAGMASRQLAREYILLADQYDERVLGLTNIEGNTAQEGS